MSSKTKVIEAALELTEAERLDVIGAIWNSIETAHDIETVDHPPDSRTPEEWEAEIARRVEEIESGRAKLTPWPEVRKRLLERYGRA